MEEVPEQTGAVAAALDTGTCVGIALWDASCCSLQEALPVPSHTGTHQSPRDSVLVPSCVTVGSDTPFLLLHVSLPACRKETTREFSWVAATFGLPEWCAEQQEHKAKSIPLSFVFGIL